MTSEKRAFILDPDLVSPLGHNFETSMRLAQSCELSGYRATVVANAHLGLKYVNLKNQSAGRVRPFFVKMHAYILDRLPKGSVRKLVTEIDTFDDFDDWESYLYQLIELDRQERFSDRDVLFSHTLTSAVGLAWIHFFRLLPADRQPKLYCQVYMSPGKIQGARIGDSGIIDIFALMKSEGLLGDRFFFHVETKRLREAYLEHGFDFPIVAGPLPMALFEHDSGKDEPLTISYLGEAREEKGFHLVPGIVETILKDLGPKRFRKLRLFLQISTNSFNQTNRIDEAKEKLSRLAEEFDNIQLFEELDSEEYKKAVRSTDLMLLAYDSEAYRVRGSGVAFEALASGKCIVTTPNIDITATFPTRRMYVAKEELPGHYAAQILRWLSDIEEGELTREGDGADFLPFREDHFFETLIGLHANIHSTPDFVSEPSRRYCLYIGLANYDGGLGFVQRAHLEALRRLGFTPIFLGIPWFTEAPARFKMDKRDFMANFLTRREEMRSTIPIPIEVTDDSRSNRFFNAYTSGVFEEFFHHEVYSSFYETVCGSNTLIDAILDLVDCEFVFTNYSFTVGLAKKFTDGGRLPLIMESHDNHSHQNALRRRDAARCENDPGHELQLAESDLEHEVKMSARADIVIHISKKLEKIYSAEKSMTHHQLLRPFCPTTSRITEAIDVIPEVDLLLKNCPSVVSAFIRHFADEKPQTIDLFYYGSYHLANNQSLLAFIEDVFIPFLMPKGLKLFVAGNICNCLLDHPEFDNKAYSDSIFLLGKVTNISDFLLAAKLVILYIIEGTGFPTKVIETLAAGQAFVANDLSLYELSRTARKYFAVPRTPKETAKDILALMADEKARKKRGAAGAEFYRRTFGDDRYLKGLSTLLFRKLSIQVDIPTSAEVAQIPHMEFKGLPIPVDQLRSLYFPITPGVRIAISRATGLEKFMSGSWSHTEDWHTWVMDGPAYLMLSWPEGEAKPGRLVVECSVQEGLIGEAELIFSLNGLEIHRCVPNSRYMNLEIDLEPKPDTVYLQLEIESTKSLSIPQDPRRLSISMLSVTMFPSLEPEPVPQELLADSVVAAGELEPRQVSDLAGDTSQELESISPSQEVAASHAVLTDNKMTFGKLGTAEPFVSSEFDLTEEGYSWICSSFAELKFSLPSPGRYRSLLLSAKLQDQLVEEQVSATIKVNGTVLHNGPMTDRKVRTWSFEMPREEIDFHITFEAEKVVRVPGDERELTWLVSSLELLCSDLTCP